jgi:hypothetical protein
MVPASNLVMSDDTLIVTCSILVFSDLAICQRCNDVLCGETISDRPVGNPVGNRRQAITTTGASIVRNRAISVTMELQHGDVVSAGRTHRLYEGVRQNS